MKRTFSVSTLALFALAACGGSGDASESESSESAAPAAEEAPAVEVAAELTTPEWFQIDNEAQTVTIDIVAGSTPENNAWNFNGFFGGTGEIVVPEGYAVTVNFSNEDANMVHSMAVLAEQAPFGALPTEPVFAGAISSNPTSMIEATLAGGEETLNFTAEAAGDYNIVCLIPGHASIGMYMKFTVTSNGDAGVR